MKKYFSFILLFVVIFGVPTYSYAQQGNWWDNKETAKRLDLSDKQIKKLDEVDSNYASQAKKLNVDIQQVFSSFMNMINSPKPSDQEITAKYNELVSKQNKIGKIELEKQLKIREILKDDQVIKLGNIRKEQLKKLRKMKK